MEKDQIETEADAGTMFSQQLIDDAKRLGIQPALLAEVRKSNPFYPAGATATLVDAFRQLETVGIAIESGAGEREIIRVLMPILKGDTDTTRRMAAASVIRELYLMHLRDRQTKVGGKLLPIHAFVGEFEELQSATNRSEHEVYTPEKKEDVFRVTTYADGYRQRRWIGTETRPGFWSTYTVTNKTTRIVAGAASRTLDGHRSLALKAGDTVIEITVDGRFAACFCDSRNGADPRPVYLDKATIAEIAGSGYKVPAGLLGLSWLCSWASEELWQVRAIAGFLGLGLFVAAIVLGALVVSRRRKIRGVLQQVASTISAIDRGVLPSELEASSGQG